MRNSGAPPSECSSQVPNVSGAFFLLEFMRLQQRILEGLRSPIPESELLELHETYQKLLLSYCACFCSQENLSKSDRLSTSNEAKIYLLRDDIECLLSPSLMLQRCPCIESEFFTGKNKIYEQIVSYLVELKKTSVNIVSIGPGYSLHEILITSLLKQKGITVKWTLIEPEMYEGSKEISQETAEDKAPRKSQLPRHYSEHSLRSFFSLGASRIDIVKKRFERDLNPNCPDPSIVTLTNGNDSSKYYFRLSQTRGKKPVEADFVLALDVPKTVIEAFKMFYDNDSPPRYPPCFAGLTGRHEGSELVLSAGNSQWSDPEYIYHRKWDVSVSNSVFNDEDQRKNFHRVLTLAGQLGDKRDELRRDVKAIKNEMEMLCIELGLMENPVPPKLTS